MQREDPRELEPCNLVEETWVTVEVSNESKPMSLATKVGASVPPPSNSSLLLIDNPQLKSLLATYHLDLFHSRPSLSGTMAIYNKQPQIFISHSQKLIAHLIKLGLWHVLHILLCLL